MDPNPAASPVASAPLTRGNRLSRWWRGDPDPTLALLLTQQAELFSGLMRTVERILHTAQAQSEMAQALLHTFTYRGAQDAPQTRAFDPEVALVERMEQEGLLDADEAAAYRKDLLTLARRS